ncbi:hypothetical protein C5167_013550 [Papaver somniferum]|uniref:Uncharacterized protein n=1 Tax=Papaver somniferum TaxID=3469 RepID=A0A4Y7J424_PAPSO|nr:hypothetical protein C5167_013550 [Papaver somniferum]
MEGLIPFLLHAMKNKKTAQNNYRCLSEGSSRNRSYHQLINTEDSSHRRTRSEFQPPSTTELFDQSYSGTPSYLRSRSLHDTTIPSPKVIESKQVMGATSKLNHRRR